MLKKWLLCIGLMPLNAADVDIQGTTLGQFRRQSIQGFESANYASVLQYLDLHASNLGDEGFSMHLSGWGYRDLADQSRIDGKGGGDLISAYAQYRFPRANADLKLGRQALSVGPTWEAMDGLSGRADLRGGFNLAFFAGKPVTYSTLTGPAYDDYRHQRNLLAGGRLGWQAPRVLDLGISYLQDGRSPVADPLLVSQMDYSRRLLTGDLRLTPVAAFDLSGRTILNLRDRQDFASGVPQARATSGISEQNYAVTWRIDAETSLVGRYVSRDYQACFAGSTLPTLFNPLDPDKVKVYESIFTWGTSRPLSITLDYRHTRRETYGFSSRFGGNLRWSHAPRNLLTGVEYHRFVADDAIYFGGANPAFGLSHHEFRAWVMKEQGAFACSLDALVHLYDDKENPNLNGQSTAYEFLGSLGYRPSAGLGVSADFAYGANALWKKEARALLRLDFRFESTGQKGSR